MENLLPLASFLTTTLFVMAVYFAISDFTAERKKNAKSRAGDFDQFGIDLDLDLETASPLLGQFKPLDAGSRYERFGLWVEQSGLRLNPISLCGLSVVLGTFALLAVGLLLSNWILGVLAFFLLAPIPFGMVAFERFRRSDKLRAQLPDALDLMSRMLRAGQTIPQSLRGVADEFEAPIADEFGYCYEQQNLGLSTEAAMYEMARRTGLLEVRILVVALTIHRQTGGNLSELLDNLANVIRERYRIQGQIRSLTADGRMQAGILLALPPILLVVLSFLNAEYIQILFQFPWILIGMFGFELIGAIWLHRIVSFDF